MEISKEDYYALKKAEAELMLLHRGGVDNWDWYSDSLNPVGSDCYDTIEREIHESIFGKDNDSNPPMMPQDLPVEH